LDNVDVIDEITNKNICGVDVLLCPWLVDYNCDKIAEKFEETKSEILFGHFDIVGFALNATRVSSEGFDPEVFSKFKKVFSGHYHTPSSKLIGKTEIIYVGSPYHMNRNDVGEHKGFLVLDMETYLYNRVVNNVSLKFVQAEYPYLPEPSDVCGNIVDALVTIRQQDLIGNSVDKYIEKIEKMNPAEKVNIVMNVIPEQHSDFENIKCDINSIPDIIELYINNDVEIDNKFEILTEIMNIYDEVK
jgi:DNA repair exonuclease SbcCD nuclease subunit